MAYTKAQDAISGKEGTLQAVIDGTVYEVAECKNITAKITKNKSEFKTVGYRGTQHKANGWSGSGTLTIHYVTSKWANLIINYANTGVDTYFTLVIKNDDPTSSVGPQSVTLTDCNIDDVEISKLDADSEFLDQAINFTFSGVTMTKSFNS